MKHGRAGLFLMELLVGILFFVLAGAVCVQIFAKASILNRESVRQDQAMRVAVKVVELYKNDDENPKICQPVLYFDDLGNETGKEEAVYTALIEKNGYTVSVKVLCGADEAYAMDYYQYRQRTWPQ